MPACIDLAIVVAATWEGSALALGIDRSPAIRGVHRSTKPCTREEGQRERLNQIGASLAGSIGRTAREARWASARSERNEGIRTVTSAPGRRFAASLLVAASLPANECRRRERERASELGISSPTSRLGEPYPGERSRMGRNFLSSRTAKWTRRAPRARFARGLSTRGKGRDPGLFPRYQTSPYWYC